MAAAKGKYFAMRFKFYHIWLAIGIAIASAFLIYDYSNWRYFRDAVHDLDGVAEAYDYYCDSIEVRDSFVTKSEALSPAEHLEKTTAVLHIANTSDCFIPSPFYAGDTAVCDIHALENAVPGEFHIVVLPRMSSFLGRQIVSIRDQDAVYLDASDTLTVLRRLYLMPFHRYARHTILLSILFNLPCLGLSVHDFCCICRKRRKQKRVRRFPS